VNSDVCCEKGNHGNCLITNNTGHSNLHSKEGPTKTLRLRHHKPFCTTSKSHQEYIRCTYLCKKKQKEARELNDSAENSSSVIKMHISSRQNTSCKNNSNLSTRILVCTDSNPTNPLRLILALHFLF
jgi:hypothetical protein